MSALRTPPWEAICFTQTGQRSGELTANCDQVSARESPGAEVCVSSYFTAAKNALSSFAKKHIASHGGCFLAVFKFRAKHLPYFSAGKVFHAMHL